MFELDAVVGLGDLAGQGVRAAAHKRSVGRGVVGRTERALRQQAAGRHRARHRVDAGGLQRLVEAHVRQDRGHAAGHQRLAGAGRADHQHVVTPGGGDLQRALGAPLALDVAEIRGEAPLPQQLLVGNGGQGHDLLLIPEVPRRLQKRIRAEDVDALDAAQLQKVRLRHHHRPHAALPGVDHHGQHAPDWPHAAVQRQLTQHAHAPQRLRIDDPAAGQQSQRDGQVVGGALLLEIRRGEVDGDAPAREAEAAVLQRRAHTLPGLLHRRVRQAHDLEHRHAVGQVDLRRDGEAIDAGQAAAGDAGEHGKRLLNYHMISIYTITRNIQKNNNS